MKKLWGSLAVVGAAAVAVACYNDADSISMEAAEFPELVDVIAGRFDRNPDLYYEMRLERVTQALATDDGQLRLYDDAAVACDRLGRSNEGIVWMDKKWAVMEEMNLTDDSDAPYRYWANIGTIRVHKWLKRGAKADEVHLLIQAYEEISKAVEVNPDAHFGREWVQLELMGDMLLNILAADNHYQFKIKHDQNMKPYLDANNEDLRAKRLEGLLGIVVLGQGWESEVIWSKIFEAVDYSNRGIQLLAERRFAENAGNKPNYSDKSNTGQAYLALRENGDSYTKNRNDFMLAKLEVGEHPDTHDEFWDGYQAVAKVDLTQFDEKKSTSPWRNGPQAILISLGIAIPFGMLVIWVFRKARAA